jgi:hypothetical protein
MAVKMPLGRMGSSKELANMGSERDRPDWAMSLVWVQSANPRRRGG